MSRYSEKLKFALSMVLFLLPAMSFAVVAKPGPVEIKLKDGSVKQVYLHGDEYLHYMTDASGKVFRFDTAGNIRESAITSSDIQKAVERRTKNISGMHSLLAGAEMPGTKGSVAHYHKGLVILVNFSDNSFSIDNPRDAFGRMLNEEGYSERNSTGSVRDYYMDNSCRQFIPSFDVYGPYQLPHNMEYYGGNNDSGDKNPWQMAIDAVNLAYDDGVNISDYDNDKDGELDYVFIYYAGYAEAYGADSKTIWPHASTMYYHNIVKGGVRYGNYACSSELIGTSGTEMDNIGAFCHEFGHVLGLDDLYDTDYDESGGKSKALGSLSLMSHGSYNNDSRTPPCLIAEERSTLGWLELKPLAAGTFTLHPIAENEAYYLDTDNDKEYFLFEARKREGWDKYIYGDGLYVYHVDKSLNVVYDGFTAASLWNNNAANVCPAHECMKVVLADNKTLEGSFFPGTNGLYTSFTPSTKPAARTWAKTSLAFEINDIAVDASGIVSFTSTAYVSSNEVQGVVGDFNSSPISNAVLTLTPASEGSVRTATTTADGSYLFSGGLPSGLYTLTCEAAGYFKKECSITLDGSPLRVNFSLINRSDTEWSLSWANSSLSGYCGEVDSYPFSIAAFWEPEDVALDEWVALTNVKFGLYKGKPDITARVYVDEVLVGEKKVNSSSVMESAYNKIDFSDQNISYRNTQSLKVVLLFKNFTDSCLLFTDAGPAVAGKGDLWGDAAGEHFTPLSDEGIDCNWMLYVTLGKNRLSSGLTCISGQRSIFMEWPAQGTSWSLSLTSGSETINMDTLAEPQILIDNLTPGTKYKASLKAFTSDGYLMDEYDFDCSTNALDQNPMHIAYNSSTYKTNGKMLLEVCNLTSGASVTWKLDNEEYKDCLLAYQKDSHTLEAYIKFSDSQDIEVIRRKIDPENSTKTLIVDRSAYNMKMPVYIKY